VLGPDQGSRHIDFLTIHPRTRYTSSSTPINLEALEILISEFGDRVPILVSGDVFALNALPFTSPLHQTTTEATTTITTTAATTAAAVSEEDADNDIPYLPKLAGLMSARAILANPALYAGYDACPWEAVESFMINAVRSPLPFKLVLHHLSEMCGPGMGADKTSLLKKQERSAMMACSNMCDLIDFLDDMKVKKAAGLGITTTTTTTIGGGEGGGGGGQGLRRHALEKTHIL
jgi:tRNA-dihydrouridine synthase 4